MKRISDEQVRDGKAKLSAAFKDLRKQGIFAKQNFMCCMGCASSSIGELAKQANVEKPGSYIGAAYYHKQDAETLRERGECHIGYGFVPGSAIAKLDEDVASLTIGQAVKLTMERHGLKVEWNGKPSQRIKVDIL